jgi:hypothetical protein
MPVWAGVPIGRTFIVRMLLKRDFGAFVGLPSHLIATRRVWPIRNPLPFDAKRLIHLVSRLRPNPRGVLSDVHGCCVLVAKDSYLSTSIRARPTFSQLSLHVVTATLRPNRPMSSWVRVT